MDTPDEGTIPIDYYQNQMYVCQDYIKQCINRVVDDPKRDQTNVPFALEDLFNMLIGSNEETGFVELFDRIVTADKTYPEDSEVINVGEENE